MPTGHHRVRSRTQRRPRAVRLLVLGVVACGLASCSRDVTAGVDVSPESCAATWSLAADGRVDTTVRNVGSAVLRVTLVDTGDGGVLASVAPLVPGTSRPVRISLPNGSYRWECSAEPGTVPGRSPVLRVTSSGTAAGHPLHVLSAAETRTVERVFTMHIGLDLGTLRRDVATLEAAVRRGDLPASRAAWLRAHADYVRMAGAQPLFGSLGSRIDAPSPTPSTGPPATGFHRLEYLLWHPGSRADQLATAAQLSRDVAALRIRAQSGRVPLPQLIAGSVSILEAASRDELTGRDDAGSHSGLASTAAAVAATDQILQALQPLLQVRDPDLLVRARAGLAELSSRLDALRNTDGTYPAPRSLSRARRQQLVAALGRALDVLAGVPATLQPPPTGDVD